MGSGLELDSGTYGLIKDYPARSSALSSDGSGDRESLGSAELLLVLQAVVELPINLLNRCRCAVAWRSPCSLRRQ